jgi:hypothetical protein
MAHATFMYYEDYKPRIVDMVTNFMEEVNQHDETLDIDIRKFAASGEKMPEFQVVVGKVQYRKPEPAMTQANKNNNNSNKKRAPILETMAYEVHCESIHVETLRMILLLLTNSDPWRVGKFIPYSWARQQPEAFQQSLIDHIEFLNTAVKFPIFNAHPRAMNGILQMDSDICMEEGEDAIETDNNSAKSALTAGSMERPMTVIEYLCCIEGSLEKDDQNMPLFYGIERTNKTDQNGLYFVVTHKDQIEEARMFMSNEFPPIYKGSQGYGDVETSYPGFKTPYMGSYQNTSDRIAQKIIEKSTDENSISASVWTTRSQSTKGSRSGIVIDYNDFPTLEGDEPNRNNKRRKNSRPKGQT